MKLRTCVLLVACSVTFALPSVAQQPSAGSWTQARTMDGQPDMQGIWTFFTLTPLERAPALNGRAVYTDAEVAQMEKRAAAVGDQNVARAGDVGADTWGEPGMKVMANRQTSLVTDPPDGRIPISPEGQAAHALQQKYAADSWEYMSMWDRCVTRGVPGGMIPGNIANGFQIIQTVGYVVVFYEMIHESHIVPLMKERTTQGGVKQLNGDSIGRWDGNTLVVDTIGFNGHAQIATSGYAGRMRTMPETAAMHLVEKFTRTSENSIHYEATIEDPGLYTRPWTMSMLLDRDDKYRMFEYACHEGNEAVSLILGGARKEEAKGRK